MTKVLPIELYVPIQPGLISDVEHACDVATSTPGGIAAVAVDSSHVARTVDLLFGTGVGVVSVLDFDTNDLLQRARLSLAAGATELAVPHIDLEAAGFTALRFVAGSDVELTVDVTNADATPDLPRAAQALALGVDFVSFNPGSQAQGSASGISDLVSLVAKLRSGGIKLAADHDGHHSMALRSADWGQTSQNARLCMSSRRWVE